MSDQKSPRTVGGDSKGMEGASDAQNRAVAPHSGIQAAAVIADLEREIKALEKNDE